MNRKSLILPACIACAALGALVGSLATAGTDSKASGGAPEFKLPKGWTPEDMQACMAAGIPGPEHAHLAKGVGTWQGKCTQWMSSDSDPMVSEATSTASSIMGGKFIKIDFAGDIPGMGPFTGVGYQGFDNVTKKYVTAWLGSACTSIMTGTGERSSDGDTMTWNYTGSCPLAKKQINFREVQTIKGDTMTFEMFMPDPKTGKEYRGMKLELTRKG